MDLVAVDQPDAVQQDGDGHQQGNGAVTDIAGDGAEHHGREDPRDHGADTEDQSQSGTGVVQPGEDEDQTSQHLHRGDDHGSGHLTVSRPLQGGAHIVGYGHVLLVDALDDEEKPDRGAQHHQKDQDIQRTVGGQPVFIKSNLVLQPAAEGVNLRAVTGTSFVPALGQEMAILAQHDVPCGLTVNILNEENRLVRRLAYEFPSRPQQLSPAASSFYWDGKLSSGEFAPAGRYTVQLKTTLHDITYICQSDPFLLEESGY